MNLILPWRKNKNIQKNNCFHHIDGDYPSVPTYVLLLLYFKTLIIFTVHW